ncbi:MAG: MFS transporter, partial [Chloroflexi bacterium]|nr:MFS transporter [Chloroflexota bacterium]
MLSRPFIALAIAIFGATMGLGMVVPVLPLYARDLGASSTEIALTYSTFAATQLVVSPFAGRLADRFGRRPFLIAGLLAYAVAALGWYLTSSIEATLLLRALSGLGAGLLFSVAFAYVGELAPRGQEGRYMGTFGLFDFLGFGVGPLIGGVIRDVWGLDAVFLAMAAVMTGGAVAIAVLLPAHPRAKAAAISKGARPSRDADAEATAVVAEARRRRPMPWGAVLRDRQIQALFAAGTSFSLAFGTAFPFAAVYLEDEIGASATLVGVAFAAQEFTGGALQPATGWLADRVSRRAMVVGGAVLVAIGYVATSFTTTYVIFLLAFAIGPGVGGAANRVATQALNVEVGRRVGLATAMGLASAAFAFGILVGSLLGGVVVEFVGTA